MALCGVLLGCDIKHLPAPQVIGSWPVQKRLTEPHTEAEKIELVDQLVSSSSHLLLAEQQDPNGWPLPPMGVVLLYEQRLCQLPRAQRNKQISLLQSGSGLPSAFDTLLLASCEPDFTPSVLARSLKRLRGFREWPASYLAYFNLLERHLQALGRLENLYGNLKENYGNLKEKMDTTIEKLTEIEVETQP
ncbi:MAG: hypothetical protein CSA49_00545 [Gammaproteobacteria bacterium]|nr:MAG: hypothetical protein CSA49_00545 [Gammaproteobacteria bacterium]